ncbi:hypothetical protein FND50_20835 [Rhodococcus sp. WB9]|uniref:hypothetical protein n=1 Tax=Rhodococcus sp. WB9 TaxID=2594007 RepID=UPI001185610D|nr:hypothetical protein [Rhodococcus sp. WB9]QDQ92962.1 hypothetical protein FND50_20835 [Rhodococcus sp. WB9]
MPLRDTDSLRRSATCVDYLATQAVVSDADSAKDELLSAPANEFAAALQQLEGLRPGTSSGAATSRRRSANEQAARLRDEIRDKRRMPTATLA